MYRWFYLASLFFLSFPIQAQQRPLGIGVVLGNPTGISVKYWQNKRNAIDGGLAWSTRNEGRFQLHTDYLWHRFDLTGESRTPLYFGIGGRLRTQGDQTGLGIRIPGGIAHLFRNDPFEIFFELVPVFDLVPETELDVEIGIGIRYYLK